jgi:hypothetical protein
MWQSRQLGPQLPSRRVGFATRRAPQGNKVLLNQLVVVLRAGIGGGPIPAGR